MGSDVESAAGARDESVALGIPQQNAIPLIVVAFSNDSMDLAGRRVR
ncbi:hypothetical protein [Nocardia sp. CY41]|nr:hypothetical protein [Nocardia sp. CY41]